MANVKITDLTAIAGVDVATNDVLPIVDINVDQTKKIAISDLQISVSDSNDFITYTQLNSNINVVQDNVAANFAQLNANLDIVQDNVAAVSVNLTIAADSGTNDTVVVGTDTLTFAGDTGITTTVSDNQISIDLDDTAVTAGIYGGKIGTVSNVPVLTIDAQGRITSASNSEVAVDLSTLEGNVNTVSSNVAAVESRRAANNTALTNEDTALQSRLTTNVTAFTNEDTALQSRLTTNVTTFTNEDTALQARITANNTLLHSNDFITFTRLNANLDVIQDNVAAIIDGSTAFTGEVTMNDDLIVTGNFTVNGATVTVNTTNMDVDDTMIMLANGTTGSPANDIGILFNRGSQGNAAFFYDESAQTFKISDTLDPKSNTSLSPVTSSNLDVGILTAATITLNSVDLSSNLAALAADIAGVSGAGAFPTGDYGLLDAANSSTDSFGVAIAGLTTFDMKTDPSGSLSTEDLGVLT